MAAFGLLSAPILFESKYFSVLPLLDVINSFVRTSTSEIRTISVFFSREDFSDLNAFQSLDIPLQYITDNSLYREETLKNTTWEPSTLIIILSHLLSVSEILQSCHYDHNSAVLVVSYDQDAVQDTCLELWKNNIISGYVLYISDYNASLYKFRPSNEHGVDVYPARNLEVVHIFDMQQSRMNVSVVNIQPAVRLIPNDETKIDGIEGRVMIEVTKKFNGSAYYNSARDGELWGWAQPKPIGVVGEVYTGYSAFGMGTLVMAEARFKYVEMIPGYQPTECISWAVPKGAGSKTPPWIHLLLTEFNIYAWITIFFLFLYAILASLWIDGKEISQIVLRIFGASVGIPVSIHNSVKSKLLMLTWMWSCFLLANCYKSSMGSKLAVPAKEPNINTLSDLLGSNLNIMSVRDTLNLVRTEESLMGAIVNRSTITTMSIEDAFDRITVSKDLAYMRPLTYFKYAAIADPKSFHKVHLMKDCALSFYATIALQKRSPFYHGTIKVVTNLFESGIIQEWTRELLPPIISTDEQKLALGMVRLKGIFVVLVVGWMFAFITFAFEFVRIRKQIRCSSYCRKKKEKKTYIVAYLSRNKRR